MEVQLLYRVANTQDGINLPVKRQKHTPVTRHLPRQMSLCQTNIGETCTARNIEVGVNKHSDVNKQSEPAKHIRKHPNNKFTWKGLATAVNGLKGEH